MYSKYHDEMPKPFSSPAAAQKMQMYMQLFRRVDEILTDNRTQYSGQALTGFVWIWSIKHITLVSKEQWVNVRHFNLIVTKTMEQGANIQVKATTKPIRPRQRGPWAPNRI